MYRNETENSVRKYNISMFILEVTGKYKDDYKYFLFTLNSLLLSLKEESYKTQWQEYAPS